MSIKLNVEDRVLSAHSLDLQKTLIENLSDVILQHGSVLPCTCMVFQPCCILSLLLFQFCNMYFQMQSLKDYFGYVHACDMFRMLISTKSCRVWKRRESHVCYLKQNVGPFISHVDIVGCCHGCISFTELYYWLKISTTSIPVIIFVMNPACLLEYSHRKCT